MATGTAVVRGRVVSADSGQPVRRVIVTLNQTGSPSSDGPWNGDAGGQFAPVSKSATTNDDGRFEFTALPAGYYRMSASAGNYRAQYLRGAYGQKRSDDPGTPFELADGQVMGNATITLPRAGVITGRITDDDGEPMARVPVYVMYFASSTASPSRTGGNQTDDLGRYRVFGLQPGDYVVVAEARNGGGPPEEESTGYMTTIYPGVPSETDGQRVRVRAGAETPGIDFRMLRGRLYTLSGSVIDSQGRPVPRVNGLIVRPSATSFGAPNVVNGFGTDPEGRFTVRSLAPGDYKIMIRPRPAGQMVINGEPQPALPEYATTDVRVENDITDLVISTRPGVTITGRVVFADGMPPASSGSPDPLQQIRIMATPPPLSFGMSMPTPPVPVGADTTFTLKGLAGPVVVRASGLPRNYIVRQVLIGSEDVTDRAHEFSERDSGELQVILTSRAAGLEGAVTDADGKPAVDAVVVLLPDSAEARRSMGFGVYRTTAVDPRGHFRMTGVRPGQWLIVAVPRDRMPRQPGDPDAVEAIAKDAQGLTVAEGEFRAIDLKISTGG